MGGKRKQAQRTKDNAKPSSSGRSAALLANATTPLSNFGSVKDCGYVPIFSSLPTPLTEEFDASIDSNFQLVLKKMNKKDSTTRLKALQEFAKLVASSELDAVKAVLPFWPRLYCLLAGDIEHRVREAAQEAHKTMVMRTKRNMAPYLRQVAGPWFTAQYDTYPPVGTAARCAFRDAFPANKLVEAIMFCRDEILKFISDNLLGPTSHLSNSAKNVSDDKLKARQVRITVSNLQGFAHFLRHVPADQLKTVAALPVVQNLLASKRFWELASDEAAPVRSAWMNVLTSVLERVPQLISERHAQIVHAVLTRLDDADPSVLPFVWEAALHVLHHVEEWKNYGNVEKLVLPPLWNVLRQGGFGNATFIFPNLLPVLDCLLKSKKAPIDQDMLCDKFFGSLREGFVKKTVIKSRAESEAVAKCYIECIRFISSTDTLSPNQLVEKQLISAVELAITNTELSFLSRALFAHVTSLVQYWSHNRMTRTYGTMLQCFWMSLADVYSKVVKTSDSDALSQQVELCLGLNTHSKIRKKVHFDIVDKNDVLLSDLPSEEPFNAEFKTEMHSLIYTVCVLYLTEWKSTNKLCFIIPLSKLVTAFNTRELFEKISSICNINDGLVLIQQAWPDYDHLHKQAAMELIFCLIQHLPAEERLPVLWSMSEEENIMLWMIGVARCHSSESHVHEWLCSSRLRDYLVELTRLICSGAGNQYSEQVVRESLSFKADRSLPVGGETASAILETLCSNLTHPEKHGEFVAVLSMSACNSIHCRQIKDTLQLLALMLFNTCCRLVEAGSFTCSSILQTAWQEVFAALVALDEEEIVCELIGHFSSSVKILLTKEEVLPSKNIHLLVKLATATITTAASDGSSVSFQTAFFLRGLQPEMGIWGNQLIALCLDSEKLVGATDVETTTNDCYYTDVKLSQYMNCSLFSLQLLALTVFQAKNDEEENEEDTDDDSLFNLAKLLNPDGRIVKSTEDNEILPETVDGEISVELDPSQADDNNDFVLAESGSDLSPQSPDECTEEGKQVESESPDESTEEGKQVESEGNSPEMTTETAEESKSQGAMESDPILDEDSIVHVEDGLLQAACSVAIFKVFRRHYQSTEYYTKISPHISTLQKNYEVMMTSLQSAGLKYKLEQAVYKRAKQQGGLWIWVHYLVCSPDHRAVTYLALRDAGRADYAAQVLAFLAEEPLSPSLLEDRPHLSTLATWLRHLIGCPTDVLGELIIGALEAWPEQDNDQLLRDCDVSTKEASEVEKVTEMIRALAACVSQCPQLLTARLWDFVLVSTPYYILSLANNHSHLFPDSLTAPSLQPIHNIAVFTTAVCDLYCSLARHVRRVTQEQDAPFLEHAREWNDVFSADVHQAFLTLYLRIADFIKNDGPSWIGHRLLQSVCCALVELEGDHLSTHSEMVKKTVTLQEVVEVSCDLIHSSVQPLQITAYHLLRKSLKELVTSDASFVASMEVGDTEDIVAEACDLKMYPLLKQLQETQAVVDIMLADFRFGDTCLVQPHTDSHHYTTAYLLLWDLLLEACGLAGSELRYHYTTIIKDNCSSLLHHLFFLMPEEVLEASSSKIMTQLFQLPPNSVPGDPCTVHELQHWACWVYHCALRRLPALVRQWWGDTKHKVNTVVQRVTYHYVSPLLCHNELHAIQTNNTKLKNMEVKVLPRAREVVASYAVDEIRMELVITLPDMYPLGMVQVNSNAPLVGSSQWRNWVRHLSIFLTHQNGSVWDGLLLWKSNLDKRFEGVEECYICFSILHGSNFQIPKLCCKACKKKFHSPCLYKWFSTSNKSTCPICRNMF